MSGYHKVIAVDFDGCLCVKKWPDIGAPNWDAIHALIRRKAEGDKVILWTCRDGQQLEDAVLWCMNHGLRFDAVNENLPENIDFFGNDCRKVWANEYWDDRAVPVSAYDCPLAGQIVVLNNNDEQKKSLFARLKERVFRNGGT